jgi:hypothetical protein
MYLHSLFMTNSFFMSFLNRHAAFSPISLFRNSIFLTFFFFICLMYQHVSAQETSDSVSSNQPEPAHVIAEKPFLDTTLRITNLQPFVTLHIDSLFRYNFDINKDNHQYFWYLNSPFQGMNINEASGELNLKPPKNYFQSGKLKYDTAYTIKLGVKSRLNPHEKIDTFFHILFYQSEITPSRLRASVVSPLYLEEGDSLHFYVKCVNGTFPIESVELESNIPAIDVKTIRQCNDLFSWKIPYDFIRDSDSSKNKLMILRFIGTDKFRNQDTTVVQVYIRNAINFQLKKSEYEKTVKDIQLFAHRLKITFRTLDRKYKRNKNTRTTFDMTSATSALSGTIFSSLPSPDQKMTGRILPSIGVALVPVKEAVAPTRLHEQNAAAQVRTSIKRLEYILTEYALTHAEDPEMNYKTNKLKSELKQIQFQMLDIVALDELQEEDPATVDQYFNNPKVNKKYKMKKRKKNRSLSNP